MTETEPTTALRHGRFPDLVTTMSDDLRSHWQHSFSESFPF